MKLSAIVIWLCILSQFLVVFWFIFGDWRWQLTAGSCQEWFLNICSSKTFVVAKSGGEIISNSMGLGFLKVEDEWLWAGFSLANGLWIVFDLVLINEANSKTSRGLWAANCTSLVRWLREVRLCLSWAMGLRPIRGKLFFSQVTVWPYLTWFAKSNPAFFEPVFPWTGPLCIDSSWTSQTLTG